MDFKFAAKENSFIYQVNSNLLDFWSNLTEKQQSILKKIWSVLTYKWQWQIILNAPFLVFWILDQTIPAVHAFDVQLISLVPIPISIKTLFGFS
tara:strand:- start:537 stop:818 length:282 start_codon:yes stop_codon:yes gene_type:complete